MSEFRRFGAMVLAEQPKILGSAFHCMDDFLASIVPDQHHELQQPAMGVKTEAEESARVVIVQGD